MEVLDEEIKKMKFDTRLMDWNIKQGILKKADIDAHLKSLPDSKDNSEPFILGNDEAEDDIESHN